MAKKDIKKLARKSLGKIGYSSFQLGTEEKETKHGLEAMIDIQSWAVTVLHDPEWDFIYDIAREQHLKYEVMQDAYGLSEDVLHTVVLHENGHWAYCPYDIIHLESILDGTARGLKAAGLDEDQVKAYTHGKANEFQDIIVNACLSIDHSETKKGRATKYLREFLLAEEEEAKAQKAREEARKAAEEAGEEYEEPEEDEEDVVQLVLSLLGGMFSGKEASKSFSVFADVQMRMYHTDAEELVKTYIKNYDEEIKPVSDAVLEAFGKDLKLSKKLVESSISDEERKKLIMTHLKNPENWEELAYEYAKLTAELGSPAANLSITPFLSKIDNDPDAKSELIQTALIKGHDPSLYSDDFEVFKEERKLRGKKIRHDVVHGQEQGRNISLPYAHLTTEPTYIPRDIRWGKTRPSMNGNGKVTFGKKEFPIIKPPAARSCGSLADLLFICDNSGSMDTSWTGLSKYSLLVDAVYAIFDDLRNEGKLDLLKYGLIQFSDSSHKSWSGWQTDSEKIEKELYNTLTTRSYGGSTNMSYLDEAWKHDVVAVVVTDGHIHNPKESINGLMNFDKIIWFQLDTHGSYDDEGNLTNIPEVPRTLLERGKDITIHPIESADDLPATLLTATRSIYKRNDTDPEEVLS